MLRNLVEEVLANRTETTSSILDVRGLLVHLDAKLSILDASLDGGKYSLERCSTMHRHLALNFSRSDVVSATSIYSVGSSVVTLPGNPSLSLLLRPLQKICL